MTERTLEQIENMVIGWGVEKGILLYSNSHAQTLKAVSEIGELADAIIMGEEHKVIDAIGDVMVCLALLASMKNLDLLTCFSQAYDEIKDRTGRMVPGGAFVKD